MPRPLKKILIRLLILLLVGLKYLGRGLLALGFALLLPFIGLWKLGLRRLAFFIYKQIVHLRVATGTLTSSLRRTFLSALGHRYVVHVIVALIVLLVSANSLQASGTDPSQDPSQALIYQLTPASAAGDEFTQETLDSDSALIMNATKRAQQNGTAVSEDAFGDLSYDKSGVAKPLPPPGEPANRVLISKPENYTVKDGDTLGEIAAMYGLSVTTILWANDMTYNSVIRPGQNLLILPVDGVLHKVKKGETLGGIAKQYSSDPDKILQANRLASADEVAVGESLIIPDGRPPAPPPPKTSIIPKVQDIFRPPAASEKQESGFALAWPTDQRLINQYFKRAHPGIDVNGNFSDHIYAAADGTVMKAGWNPSGYGNMILIDHGNGMVTRYGHASKLFVHAGDTVTKGQAIGMIGTTGRSTGPHLHYEVYLNGTRRNPLTFYKR